MTPFESNLESTIRINLDLLFAVGLGAASWWLWPSSIEWYGFGFLSLCCALAAFGVLIRALRTLATLYTRRKAMQEYLNQGGKPKASTLASSDIQEKAGMR